MVKGVFSVGKFKGNSGQLIVSGFDPTDIANLSLWLDASDASTITTETGVSQWDDKETSAANNATQGTGSLQPATGGSLNSLNVINWDGTDDLMNVASFTSILSRLNAFTVFILFKADTAAGTLLASTIDGSNRFAIGFASGDVIGETFNGSDFTVESTPFSDTVSGHVVTVTNSSSNVISLFLDGIQGAGTDLAATANTAGTTIGARTDGGVNYGGDIAEIAVYSRELTSVEISQVETYLSDKWIAVVVPDNRITEDGDNRITEDGDNRILD